MLIHTYAERERKLITLYVSPLSLVCIVTMRLDISGVMHLDSTLKSIKKLVWTALHSPNTSCLSSLRNKQKLVPKRSWKYINTAAAEKLASLSWNKRKETISMKE